MEYTHFSNVDSIAVKRRKSRRVSLDLRAVGMSSSRVRASKNTAEEVALDVQVVLVLTLGIIDDCHCRAFARSSTSIS
jgi:hypothetical protein